MNFNKVIKELKEHAPFTGVAVLSSFFLVFVIQHFLNKDISEDFFHIFHFSHIFFSAMVTGALYYKYKSSLPAAFLVGVTGAIIIGSLSDVIFPYLGGSLLNIDIHLHLPLIQEPIQTLFFVITGSLAGLLFKATKLPHFAHVFLSVFASLFYLLIFIPTITVFYFFAVTVIVFIAVITPCCLSDIIFPLIFINNKK